MEDIMATCQKCGTEASDNEKYCLKCGEQMDNGSSYLIVNIITIAAIIIGFIMPFVFIIALIPAVYLYTRPVNSVKQRGKLYIIVSLLLLVIMLIVWSFIDHLI
jgi:hypothetical protein